MPGDAAAAVREPVDAQLDLLIAGQHRHPTSVWVQMPVAVDTYRERLEEMTAEAMEEYYLHAAGLKPTYEIAAVYERYADLTTLDQARALAAGDAPAELQRFACEAYIGDGTKHLSEELANTEAALVVDVDGADVPYREVPPRLVNEPDRDRRLRPLHRPLPRHRRAAESAARADRRPRRRARRATSAPARCSSSTSGSATRRGRCTIATSAFLAATDDLYRRRLDAELRSRVGVALADAAPPDLARLWRAPEFDAGLPARPRAAGAARDARRPRHRPRRAGKRRARRRGAAGKMPRAFCAPIRVPGRVVLVMLPQGGQDDYRALFHEAGHAEHFAHMPERLRPRTGVLGDNAVTEGFAFLFEHLLVDPAWLPRPPGRRRTRSTPRFSALYKLFLVRRYAAKLAYEIELHAAGARLERLPARYAELLSGAVGVPYPATDYLEDVDDGFYCTSYLRAWAFEAQLADHLRTRFGRAWFADPRAGELLREMWALGQSLRAEALLRQVAGAELDFARRSPPRPRRRWPEAGGQTPHRRPPRARRRGGRGAPSGARRRPTGRRTTAVCHR